MRLLIKANGFIVLHNCMNLVFKELPATINVSPNLSKDQALDENSLDDLLDETVA